MMEVSTCAGSIHIVQTQFCIGDGLTVDACHIEFEQKIFDGAVNLMQDLFTLPHHSTQQAGQTWASLPNHFFQNISEQS